MIQADLHSSNAQHVVHIIASLQTGGAEKQLVNYLHAADRTEFRHSVLCLSHLGDFADEVEKTGSTVTVKRVRIRHILRDLKQTAAWLRKEEATVVHTHMFPAAFWGRTAALMAGVPVIVTTEHGKEPWKKWWHIAIDRWLSGKTFKHIAVSHDVMKIRQSRDGVPDSRIQVIPNGVPIPELASDDSAKRNIRAEFGIESETPVIGTVGRVVEAKAYPVLLDALIIARQTIPNLHWLQVGDGPDLESLVNLASQKGVDGAVTFVGRRGDIPALLEAMDLWVMSSIREGLPVALLEAMAASKPIVATNVGGIPDALEGHVSGLLVPSSNPEALAKAMVQLIQNQQEAEKLAVGARARATEFYGIAAVASQIEKIYRDGLASKLS